MTEKQGFMTALYERLSRDDELNGEIQQYFEPEETVGTICKRTWIYQSCSFY